MAERVAIVAVGQTKYQPNRADVREEELAYEAVKQVLEETGLTLSEINSRCYLLPRFLGWQNHIEHAHPACCGRSPGT